jgi:hypothetical protein
MTNSFLEAVLDSQAEKRYNTPAVKKREDLNMD